MKQKCSFILKASTALVLALLMLFGSMTTSLAAVISDSYDAAHGLADTGAEADVADTGADADLAETGDSDASNIARVLFVGVPTGWNSDANTPNTTIHTYYAGGDGTDRSVTYTGLKSGDNNNYIYVTSSYTSKEPRFGAKRSDNGWYADDSKSIADYNMVYIWYDNGAKTSYTTYQLTSTASLSADDDSITTAETAQLTPALTSNTSYNTIKSTTYSVTTNPGSAGSVTSAGVFSATAAGTYVVTATVTYNAIGYTSVTKTATATETINVTAVPTITSVTSSSSSLKIGETATITTVLANTSSPTVTYSSSDSTVLSVTKVSNTSATIKALKPGSATITANLTDGSATDSATTSSISVATPKFTLSYSPTSIKATGRSTSTPTVSINTSYANSSSTSSNLSYSITSGTSYATINSSTGVITSKTSAGSVTVKVTGTITYNGVSYTTAEGTATVTVSALPTVYFKHSTTKSDVSGGGDGTRVTMTYDSTASTTLGGDAVVYKATLSSLTAAAHYWVIYNGSANRYYATNINSNAGYLGSSGYSTAAHSNGNAGTITPPYAGNTVVYYNLTDNKVYVELPIRVTYQGYCTAQSKNVGTAATETKAYGATATSGKTITATGYTQVTPVKWYTSNALSTEYNFPALTGNKTAVTIYTPMTANTYTVTLDANTNGGKITKTSGGTAANTATFTHTYGVADTIASQYSSVTPPDGYTFDGWYDSASSGTKYTSVGATAITAAKTYYAHYTEVKAGATVKAYTNGSASGTGGTVKVGSSGTAGATATIDNNTFGIDTASPAIIKASTADGYEFKGWQFNSTNLYYSFNGTSYTKVASTSTTYGTSSDDTVYVKTDGTSGMTTDNTEIHAMFESAKYTITYSGKYTDNGTTQNAITATQGTFTVTNNSNSGANVASGSTVNYQNKLTVTATPAAGYVVDGIYYKTTADGTWSKMTTATNASTGAVYNNNFNVESNWFFEARFKKIYHISLYNTTEEVGGDFRYVTGPPMRVTVTPSGGTAVTYTYKKNASATSEGNTRTSGDYNEGDLLTVYAGDTVVLSYAALASSDTITGVFFNNARRYTCEGENDNLYKLREYKAAGWDTDGDDSWDYDYMAATTLYANENYYEGSVATTIAGQKANYQAKDGVDNNMHTVTFVAKSDYLNIDLEIATKRQFIFTDETGLDIRSEMMDNYYNPLSEVSASSATTKFGIKLATSDTCTYDWGTGAKVKFYRDAACTDEITGVFTVASSADSSGYFVISGTMPNYNVYIKPNIVTKYQVSLGTVMLADVSSNNYQYWNQAADVSLNYGGTKYKNEKYDGITAPSDCIKAITKGDTVTFISSNYNDKTQYTFLGWYKGTSTGPDYKNGLLSEKETFNFIPRENTYVYAVGTRDLFINGCKYITGATSDWNKKNDVPQNFKMEFDPTKGTKGMYYWELDAETLYAAVSSTGYTNGGGVNENGSHWYWNNNTNMGNSWFQIMDSPTGWDRSAVWGANDDSDFKTTETNKIEYGKIRKGTSGDDWKAVEACGYIIFKESDSPGWSAPLRIYVDPTATGANKGRFTVEPTPTYSNLYVSNGFDVGGTSRGTATTVTVPTGETSFTIKSEGGGWNPDHEGHVQHYIPQKKNAKVRITKTCSANEQVVAFDVYDIDNDDFYSRTDVTASGNNYYIDLQCTMQQNLYIVPVVQEKSADLTINFDGTQLNKTQWGEIVTAYAWYSDGSSTHALGAYPGQPMVVSDDGNTWTAAIPSTRTISGTKYTLAGILFTNYVDGNHSWLGCGSVMGTEQNAGTQSISTTGGIIQTYNIMKDTDYRDGTYHGTYNKANFKAQTYDYREPVAIYNNAPKGDGVKTTITFAMKDGDSSLISWRHTDLLNENVVTETNPAWKLRFEYLTNSTGKKYSDLNGHAMEGTPTATYYIAAKGQVIYKNDSMTDVYYSGKSKDTPSPAVSYGLSGTSINFNYAVQWYVYDAQGNYITNVLSAAFADQKDGMSYIAKQLDDLGYAVDGKSVAICYDKPRYMYQDTGGVINSGTEFDAYRFEGQWYATVQTEPVTVSVGVGMMTENGEVIADTNHPGYGDATAAYSTTYGTALYAHSSDGDKSVTVALADASKRLVKLDANATNFVGWYYYDANTNKFTKASYKNATDFYPNFNADVTYYAMYEAKAVYQYNYTGREGAKTFSVAGGALTDAEMTDGNKVATTRTDFGSKSPGASDVSVFKKNISFNTTVTTGMLNNTTPYIMNIDNATITDAEYTVTAHYCNASGSLITKAKTATYNTPVDFTSENSGTSLPSVYAGHKFLGWFECDSNGANIGNLLSTQANYGLVVVKNQHIFAVYENDGSGKTVSDSDVFTLFADDHEITREKYSASTGTYYNDTIIRLRNDSTGNLTSLPSGAEVGILVINANDSGQSTVVSNQDNLTNFATNLTNGQTAAVGSKGRTVTKVSTTTLNKFGRADLAMRCDYGTVNGTAYSVYAYYKNPSGAYTFVTVSESGTYTIG